MASSAALRTLFSILYILPVSFAQSPTIGFISPDVVTDIGKLILLIDGKKARKDAENVVPILVSFYSKEIQLLSTIK